jgi:hypothetical protein
MYFLLGRAGARRSELGDEPPNLRRCAWHNAAQHRAVERGVTGEFPHEFRRRAIEPARRGNVGLLHYPLVVCQTDVRVRVADVEKQNHFNR